MTADANAHADPQTPASNPALARLAVFVGQWRWEASAGGQVIGSGRTVFEWLEGGAFLMQHAQAETAGFPAGTTVIGADDETSQYCMLQYDSRVICRIYQMSLADGTWELWRDASGFLQRFSGTFSDDGQAIAGRWEQSSDGSRWEVDFDLTYTKVS